MQIQKTDILLIVVLLFIVYELFFSNKIEMQNMVKLTNKEIETYTLYANKDNNQTAIEALWAHYAIYENNENMSCYWWKRKKIKSDAPKYCEKKEHHSPPSKE